MQNGSGEGRDALNVDVIVLKIERRQARTGAHILGELVCCECMQLARAEAEAGQATMRPCRLDNVERQLLIQIIEPHIDASQRRDATPKPCNGIAFGRPNRNGF